MTAGSVRRDGEGWMFVVDVSAAGAPRRRQVRRRRFDTKKAALSALQELQHQARSGAYVAPSKQTVATFLSEWLEAIRPTVRPSTWASYERNVRVHVVTRIGDFPLQAVDPGTIAKLYASLLADGHRGVNGYASRVSRPRTRAPRAWRRGPWPTSERSCIARSMTPSDGVASCETQPML